MTTLEHFSQGIFLIARCGVRLLLIYSERKINRISIPKAYKMIHSH